MADLSELKNKLVSISVQGVSDVTKLPTIITPQIPRKIKAKLGRPIAMTKEVIAKIEEVAALDGSVEEMAMYAGIGVRTLYDYLKANEDFSQRIAALRERPILKARNTIVADLANPDSSKWYLERKARKEFSPKVEVEMTAMVLQIDL